MFKFGWNRDVIEPIYHKRHQKRVQMSGSEQFKCERESQRTKSQSKWSTHNGIDSHK